MARLTVASLLATGILVSAQASTIEDNQDALQQKMDSLDVKRGLEVGGSVRALFTRSAFSSEQDANGADISPDREQDEWAQFDLKLGFRPWEATRANLILRFGAGAQDYFMAATKSVSVSWMNVEGKIGDHFYWVAGDFRQQISPLTLYSPSIDIMYEPEVYRRNRYMAQDQVYLSGNQRNLQGFNLQYRQNLSDMLGEVRAEGIFSRLRRIEQLDGSGALGNLLPNDNIAGSNQSGNMDKYLGSMNIEMYPMKKNLMIGVTQMFIWDSKSSLVRDYMVDSAYVLRGGVDPNYHYKFGPINPYDTLPQSTSITSIRLGADGAGLLDNSSLILDATAEYAMSKDRVYSQGFDYVLDNTPDADAPYVVRYDAAGVIVDTAKTYWNAKKDLSGYALLINADLGFQQKDNWMVKLGIKYLMSDTNWFNNVAQSPSFYPRRIMNVEKDADYSKYGVYSPLYSTFDAMYHFTPKFTPATTTLGNSSLDANSAMGKGQTESYNIAPFAKNSWTTAVLTRDELNIVNALSDPNVQLALPNGDATSNRVGFQLNPIAGYGKGNPVEVQGLLAQFAMTQAPAGMKKVEYSEMGGGAKVDVLNLLGFSTIGEISGSYKLGERSLDQAKMNTTFLNTGLYVKYFKRFGFTAGFQAATMKLNQAAESMGSVAEVPVVKGEQNQWMVGLDYTLAKNAWVTLNFGMINVKNTYAAYEYAASSTDENKIVPVSNLPDYINALLRPGVQTVVHEFSQNLIDASINVDF